MYWTYTAQLVQRFWNVCEETHYRKSKSLIRNCQSRYRCSELIKMPYHNSNRSFRWMEEYVYFWTDRISINEIDTLRAIFEKDIDRSFASDGTSQDIHGVAYSLSFRYWKRRWNMSQLFSDTRPDRTKEAWSFRQNVLLSKFFSFNIWYGGLKKFRSL